ncbi:hypothetical protein PENTCL1PPCAC_7517, partial [Pristionchus entomophagus]
IESIAFPHANLIGIKLNSRKKGPFSPLIHSSSSSPERFFPPSSEWSSSLSLCTVAACTAATPATAMAMEATACTAGRQSWWPNPSTTADTTADTIRMDTEEATTAADTTRTTAVCWAERRAAAAASAAPSTDL